PSSKFQVLRYNARFRVHDQGAITMTVGFGIIGCGMISNFHAKAIAEIEGASLAACFDTFPESADRFAASTGCTAYHNLKKMLADPAVQVVTICTPSGAHL